MLGGYTMSTSTALDDARAVPGVRSALMERLRAEDTTQERSMTARERASRALALGRSLAALQARVRRAASNAP